jgi:hypothetical protein
LVRGLVVGRLEDLHDVEAPQGDEGVEQLSASLLDRAFRFLHPVAPRGDAAHPL